jgi:hypothetical protein
MMKYAALGSCLTGQMVRRLTDAGYVLLERVHHIRTDALNRYLESPESFGLPAEEVSQVLEKLPGALEPKVAKTLNLRLSFQSHRKIQAFLDSLKDADFLVVDNQYDTRRPLFAATSPEGRSYCLSNVELAPELGWTTKRLGLMDPKAASDVYHQFVSQLRLIRPDLKIIFINYPVSPFLGPKGLAEPVVRSRAYTRITSKLPITAFPLLRVDSQSDVDPKNTNHFSEEVYDLYAQAIARVVQGTPLPFDPAAEISVQDLRAFCGTAKPAKAERQLEGNPYDGLPERQYWKRAVGDRFPLAITDLYDRKYPIALTDRVATCGSCFAQHIGRRMKAGGFGYMDVEPAPKSLPASQHVANGYGIYSGRYGNVYTSTQLLQLLRRALGKESFSEAWEMPDGRFADPFRPNLVPEGFETPQAMLAEQARHLQAVRGMFESLDLFIFTLGLTEQWFNKQTGAVYPIAPGVTAGKLDPQVHSFRNLGYQQVLDDMLAFIDLLKSVNPECRMLLTVSPVPLTATAEDRHVLVSTMHSKSILRTVAGELASRFDFVDYFPSYEIVSSPPFRGMFFQPNLRTVHDQGVDFVMSHFFAQHQPRKTAGAQEAMDNEDFCDEVFLDLERSEPSR